tara:strand:+ start:285 stop:521 length:237 start_codon:yes stop_codon:yes gene_type:complete
LLWWFCNGNYFPFPEHHESKGEIRIGERISRIRRAHVHASVISGEDLDIHSFSTIFRVFKKKGTIFRGFSLDKPSFPT